MLGVSGVSVIFGGGLTSDDVGARVSVRRRASDGVGDVIGDLHSLDADGLAIRLSDGSLVVVAAASLVAARVVGPSRLSARELEAVSGRAVRVSDEKWLGRWWLRAGGGLGARANSVRPLGDPGVPLDAALETVGAWYRQRGLMPTVRVITGSRVDEELDQRGWTAAPQRSVQTATVASMRRRLDVVRPGFAVPLTQLASQPSAGWLGRYRNGTILPTAAAALADAPDVAFAMIESGDDGVAAIAIGRAVVEQPWVGFAAIEVDPGSRRRGYSRAVMAALVEWAAGRGATRGYLEVMADNQPALALYASLGFTEHHRYTYRSPAGAL
jgi:N-acetylglutamate synthase